MLRGPSIDKGRRPRLIEGIARLITATPPTWPFSISLAVALLALGTLVRAALQPVVGSGVTFACYYLVVTLAAVLGGYRAGALALTASAVVGWYFFATPQRAIEPLNPRDTVALGIFLVSASLQGLIAATLRYVVLQLRERDVELRLIADELRHRVKNVLTLVQSVSRQIGRTASDTRDFQAALETRLKALANAHDILARCSWAGAGLRDLISAHLNPFVSVEGPRLLLEGEDLTLDPDTAVSLSLVLHELATNAVKYGALSTPKGELRLSWRRDGARDALLLDWLERGGPKVEAPRRKGFGATLIARTLAPGGRIDYEPEGLHVVASLPLGGRARTTAQDAPEARVEPRAPG